MYAWHLGVRLSPRCKTLEKIAWGFSLAGRTDTRRSIHQQKAHGREIVLAQDPALHLTWKDDTIFIKPLPASLTVNDIEEQGKKDPRVCGYLHSYTDLIQDPLDLQIAIELNLLPWRPFYENAQKKRSIAEQWASWDEIRNRINDLGHKRPDFSRHPRYEYGELRISRLNLLTICRKPWSHFFHANSRHLEYWCGGTTWSWHPQWHVYIGVPPTHLHGENNCPLFIIKNAFPESLPCPLPSVCHSSPYGSL